MKKPRSSRPGRRTAEPAPRAARVLLFPCLVQLPRREASATGQTTAPRRELVLDDGGSVDAARAGAGRAR